VSFLGASARDELDGLLRGEGVRHIDRLYGCNDRGPGLKCVL